MRDVDAATTGKYVSISCSKWDGLKRFPEFSVILYRMDSSLSLFFLYFFFFFFFSRIDRIAKNSTTKAMPQFPVVISTAVSTKRLLSVLM
jgi:hypothetical protein